MDEVFRNRLPGKVSLRSSRPKGKGRAQSYSRELHSPQARRRGSEPPFHSNRRNLGETRFFLEGQGKAGSILSLIHKRHEDHSDLSDAHNSSQPGKEKCERHPRRNKGGEQAPQDPEIALLLREFVARRHGIYQHRVGPMKNAS